MWYSSISTTVVKLTNQIYKQVPDNAHAYQRPTLAARSMFFSIHHQLAIKSVLVLCAVSEPHPGEIHGME